MILFCCAVVCKKKSTCNPVFGFTALLVSVRLLAAQVFITEHLAALGIEEEPGEQRDPLDGMIFAISSSWNLACDLRWFNRRRTLLRLPSVRPDPECLL